MRVFANIVFAAFLVVHMLNTFGALPNHEHTESSIIILGIMALGFFAIDIRSTIAADAAHRAHKH